MTRTWHDGADEVDREAMAMLAMEKLQLVDGTMCDDTPPTLPPNVRTSAWKGYRESSATSLTGLNAITIPELLADRKHHCGKVLYGKFCIEPVMTESNPDVATLLVDKNASAIRVIMSKRMYCDELSRGLSESGISMGKEVAIKEPSVEMCQAGVPAVRVINLSQVISLDVEYELRAGEIDATLLEELENIRHDGNQFFANQDWTAAVQLYTRCINQALLLKPANNGSLSSEKKLSRLLLFAYSNRAEARLRLELYEDAFSDTEKAVQIEPNHLKTLVRKGRSAYALGLFEKSCEALKAALQQSPGEKSILKCLKASTTALNHSRTGEYNLSDYFLRDCTGEVPVCVDFVGPVEIRRVDDVNGQMGLFAKTIVKAGDLLLVSNALAVCRKQNLVTDFDVGLVTGSMREDLTVELSKRTATSKRRMAQLCSLCKNGKDEMEVPSMELFKAGSEWSPDRSEFELDGARMSEIVSNNSYLRIRLPIPDVQSFQQDVVPDTEVSLGVWALPSFARHSCSPNVCRTYIGDAVFFRASASIVEGEELTISHLEEIKLLHNRVEARQALIEESLGFTCNCPRCLVEVFLRRKLSKVRKAFSFLRAAILDSRGFFFLQSQEQRLVDKDLANLVNEVELVLLSCGSGLAPKEKDWIRSTFFLAYIANFRLALSEANPQTCILAIRLVLNMFTSVCVGPITLMNATRVLKDVQKHFGIHAETSILTLEQVSSVYNIYFGPQEKDVLQKLLRLNLQKLD